MTKPDKIVLIDAQLREITERCREFEAIYAAELLAVHPEYRDSARNLVHYLALRECDIQELQENLTMLGLSSLDRSERNVMASIRAVPTTSSASRRCAPSTSSRRSGSPTIRTA